MASALALTCCDFPVLRMADNLKDTILNAFRQLLRPLVRILLRNGVSFNEFEETTKMVFVEVARRDFLDNQDSLSAISQRTGLHSDEVARVEGIINTTAP
nr:DUF6502 family protein [Gammaproteobacteria bacterium]